MKDAAVDDVVALLVSIDGEPLDGESLLDEGWHSLLDDSLGVTDAFTADIGDGLSPVDGDDATGESPPASVGSDSGGEEEGPTGMEPPSARRPRARSVDPQRRRAYRAKQKAELHELRATTTALASKVATVRAQRNARLHATARDFNSGWKGVAFRQRQRRMQAEAVNRELRALLHRHHALALQAIRSLQVPGLGLALTTLECRRPIMVFDDRDLRLIDTFRRELADRHARADKVLAQSKIPSLRSGDARVARCVHKRYNDDGCEFVEVVDAHVVPFAFPSAAFALHKMALTTRNKECEPAISRLPDSKNALGSKYQLSSGGDGDARYNCISVDNGVPEADRWVYVWRAILSECGSPEESFSVEGWGTAKAWRGDSNGQSTGTIFEFCTRFWSHSNSPIPNNDPVVKYLERVALTAPDEVEKLTQAIENVLVDEMTALPVSSHIRV